NYLFYRAVVVQSAMRPGTREQGFVDAEFTDMLRRASQSAELPPGHVTPRGGGTSDIHCAEIRKIHVAVCRRPDPPGTVKRPHRSEVKNHRGRWPPNPKDVRL